MEEGHRLRKRPQLVANIVLDARDGGLDPLTEHSLNPGTVLRRLVKALVDAVEAILDHIEPVGNLPSFFRRPALSRSSPSSRWSTLSACSSPSSRWSTLSACRSSPSSLVNTLGVPLSFQSNTLGVPLESFQSLVNTLGVPLESFQSLVNTFDLALNSFQLVVNTLDLALNSFDAASQLVVHLSARFKCGLLRVAEGVEEKRT
jgi:hypothetical protein